MRWLWSWTSCSARPGAEPGRARTSRRSRPAAFGDVKASRARLRTIAGIARRSPVVVAAALALLESVLEAADRAIAAERTPTAPPAVDAARSDRYQIRRRIGAGGHAEVLLAVVRGADGFHRPVVVK